MSQRILLRGGWVAEVIDSEGGHDIRLSNPKVVDDGQGDTKEKEAFFVVTTEGNSFGAPVVVQEPALGVPCRDCGMNVDGCIVGALVIVDGKVVERFSWSNIVLMKGGKFAISADGQLSITPKAVEGQPPPQAEAKGWLRAIFLPDKNRMRGYVGVFGPEKPDVVKVLEMEDLLVASL